MELQYLSEYSSQVNLPFLESLKHERLSQLELKANEKYFDILCELKKFQPAQSFDAREAWVKIGTNDLLNELQNENIEKLTRDLIPWRKGPFELFNLKIDAEWRSDYKWDRIKNHLPQLSDKKVLDIGCNNGYFMFRMADQNPKLVMGIEPVIHNFVQFQLLNTFANLSNLKFELFGIEHLHAFNHFFDVVFSMGIIYHHRHPIQQLIDIKNSMNNKGTLIIETIGIPGEESYALFPEDRYAKMRNVWFVPTLSCFINWVKRAKFKDIEVIYDVPATSEEQRLTEWCPPPRQSFEDFLDPNNPEKTVEGHPAPRRFCIKATKID